MRILNQIRNKIESFVIYKEVISYYFLAFTGGLFFSILLYTRFLRQRLPRDIPFNLTEWWLIILICICIIYLYTVIRTLKPKTPALVITIIIEKLTMPLAMFYGVIKANKIVNPYYTSVMSFLIKKIIDPGYIRNALLLLTLKIIPKLILVSIFVIDVVIFKQIKIFYYFIFLSVFPLMYNLIIYALQVLQQEYFQEMDTRYTKILVVDKKSRQNLLETGNPETANPKAIYHEQFVSLKKFMEIQEENLSRLYDKEDKKYDDWAVRYEAFPMFQKAYEKEYREKYNRHSKLTYEDDDILEAYFHENIELLQELTDYLNRRVEADQFYRIKLLTIITYGLYFIAWGYILIISFPTLKEFPLVFRIIEILQDYLQNLNPFSNP